MSNPQGKKKGSLKHIVVPHLMGAKDEKPQGWENGDPDESPECDGPRMEGEADGRWGAGAAGHQQLHKTSQEV